MDAQKQTVDVGLKELYSAWASGRQGEAISFAVGAATNEVSDRIAADLYALHVMADAAHDYCLAVRAVKDWGYRLTAEYVTTRAKRGTIPGYRLDWGRQAARDGLCDALWGHVRGTGLAARASQFGVGERPYQRLRDHVRDTASALLTEFESHFGAAIGVDDYR